MEDESGKRVDTFHTKKKHRRYFLMAEEPFSPEFLPGQILLQIVPSKIH